jgi:phosphoribosylformimino-5-aminoimidazole carboxamide ribotide isomerase
LSPLTLYPAIDLKGGACVRLRQGEMDQATVYGTDPGAQATAWQQAGATWLHVVDLDGAFAGRSLNGTAVAAILAAARVPVQLGGGIRDMTAIESWLEAGIRRVILGSIAARDPALVREACRRFPGRVVIGIDSRGGKVATEGWAEASTLGTIDLALRFEDAGAAAIIFTDIGQDGMLSGLSLDQTVALAQAVSTPVIASGGVGSVTDLRALRAIAVEAPGIEGVIVGRALYDGRLTLAEGQAALSV